MIGLGRMGSAMARRFHAAGWELVLWNRERTRAETISEETPCTVASTPAEAARHADLVVSSLADDDALKSVYLGPSGVVEGLGTASIAMDMSTVDPETVLLVGRAVDATGAGFLDCPVSGSVSTVEAGGLVIMAGGDPDLIARAEPLLASIAKQVIRVESTRCGSRVQIGCQRPCSRDQCGAVGGSRPGREGRRRSP